MNYELTKKTMMDAYPSLFTNEADVLDHLFFVIGNGYYWENGELTDGCEDPEETIEYARNSSISHAEQEIEYLKQDYNSWGIEYWEKYKARQLEPPEKQREFEINKRREYLIQDEGTDCWFINEDGSIGNYVYPLCKYAKILHIPEDIKIDWLEAAERAISMVEKGLKLKFHPNVIDRDALLFAKVKEHVKERRVNK